MAIHTTAPNEAPPHDDRPYRDAPLSRIVEQIEFAYSDKRMQSDEVFDLIVEVVRRAEAAESGRSR